MPDTASDPSTSRTIEVDGATLSDTLDFNGDHDWFAVTLVAGQTYTFITSSSSGTNDTSTDTTLAVRDPSGTLLAFNDDYDNPPGQFSQITFTATVSGIYYLDVGGYNDADTGAYQISATTALPTDLPVFTNDEIALQLTDGYWDGDDHHFDVVAGGSLTVNLDSLTTQGLFLARAALELWSDVIGITFVELPAGETVDIEFTDDEAGAFTSMSWSNGIMDFAQVNVSTQWLQSYGSGLNSYSMQTYVHEIGHALGLGHGGNYNGTASYPSDALYANDAWPATIMSYFDQRYDNSWFSAQGFTYQYVLSPMVADIVAATNLYGPRGALTRTGDTTYGFNNTSGRDIYDPAVVSGATVAIIDDGGVDTLDYSLTGNSQQIYLEPELFSNVLGRTGNLVIARGTVIENAIGGSGSDIIIGNGANNVLTGNGGMDILYGKDGNDTLDGGAGDDEIDGGAGADTIIASAGNDRYRGGSGTDTFVFGPALASLDAPVITDFEAGDLIDLNGSTVTIASFIGTADFSGTAGEYRFYWLGDQTIVEYDGNGDGAPDGSLTIGNGAFTLVQVTTPAGAHNLQIEGSGPVNSAPTLDNPLADRSSDEDTALSFAIPADAFGDADGDTLAYSARLASGGALPAWLAFDAATRTFSGTPVQDFNGTIEIEVTASDGTAQASDVFTLTILPVNDAPVAVDDSVSANQDTVAVFTIASLLGNDSDVDGDQLALSLPGSTTAQGGTIALTGDTITYTPAPGFFGDDSFTYLVSDGNGGTDTATVTIDVARNTVITGTPGNDRLTGTPLADEINGLGGNDIIDGRGGDDTMRGGAGDDTYYIDSSADLVVELAGEGRDFVIATANFVLGANVEDLRLQNYVTHAEGNELDNVISASPVRNPIEILGHGGNDNIRGGKYDDALYGGDGDDYIFGDDGDDYIDGGAGNDRILGGAGDDEIDGGPGDDFINASGGNDTIRGGDGEDILLGRSGVDIIDGGADGDLIRGAQNDDQLSGGSGRDQLFGDDGDDWLQGGADQDFFTGGNGADTFVFDDPDMAGTSGGSADRILDFSRSDGDVIDLSAIDAVAAGDDDAFNFIGDAAFSGTAGELRYVQQNEYTMLQMDIDGDGRTDFAVRVEGQFDFIATDFIL